MQKIRFGWRQLKRVFVTARLILLACLAILPGLLLLPIPILVSRVIYPHLASPGIAEILPGLLGLIVLTLLSGITLVLVRRRILKETKSDIARLRNQLVQFIYDLPLDYFGSLEGKRVRSLIVEDTERIDVMVNGLIGQSFPAVIVGSILSALLLYLNWRLTLILIAITIVGSGISRHLARLFQLRVKCFREAYARFTDGADFSLRFIELTHLHGVESWEKRRRNADISQLESASYGMAWFETLFVQTHFVGMTAAFVAVILAGRFWPETPVSETITYLIAIGLLRTQWNQFISTVPHILLGYRSLVAVTESLPGTSWSDQELRPSVKFQNELSLANVEFGYADQTLFKPVTFRLTPGKLTALTGPNGVGKTTLVRLILGLISATKGEIRIDGIPLSQVNGEAWRRTIAVVPQNAVVFGDTVRVNLTYGEHKVDELRLARALRDSGASFVEALPQGLDTFIGENGHFLSGGQRQKLAIARALYRQASLLILDEPSHHLDQSSLKCLFTTLKSLPHRPAVLIISHDRSLTQLADEQRVIEAVN